MAASLGLQPHPEGGYYLETYRSGVALATSRGERSAATAIVFLITAESPSKLHRLSSDELWVFQDGLPLELVTLSPEGGLETRVLGGLEDLAGSRVDGVAPTADVAAGLPAGSEDRVLQALVPAGSWQGARLAGGPQLPVEHAWALVSCVVTPGFDFADFEMGEREALLAAYPQHAEVVGALS